MTIIARSAFPEDDDGEVLYRLASKGIDLNIKRRIEFYCYAENENTAVLIVEDLSSYGYDSSIFVDDSGGGSSRISVYSSITMRPKYELIVLEQKRLDLLLEPYNTNCDGWMTESRSS
jgi:Regulator of ribonuclease activity B